jgi:hypothetical protein
VELLPQGRVDVVGNPLKGDGERGHETGDAGEVGLSHMRLSLSWF